MIPRGKIVIFVICSAALLIFLFADKTHAANCTVTFSGINFGNYDALSSPAFNYDVDGTITVNCTGGGLSTIHITMSPGNSGAPSQRHMVLAASPNLNYNVFTDSARQNVWSDTDTAVCTVNNVCLSGSGSVSVFGRIPGGQDVSAGSYADTLTATIIY